jgi:hypothetical protein
MTQEELPDVYQAELDADTYEDLFADWARLEGPLQLSLKRSEHGYVDAEQQPSLRTAKQQLESGLARALQARYAYEGDVWIDTLLRHAHGFRLIRTRAPG